MAQSVYLKVRAENENNVEKKRALFVTTTASMIDQFNRGNIDTLQKLGYEVHVACNLNTGNTTSAMSTQKFIEDMQALGVRIFDYHFTRTPFAYGKNMLLSLKLRKQIKKYRYMIIHCHTPVGGVVARIAAAFNVQKWGGKVIYTAHGFHFFRGAPRKNWVLFYPIERELSWVTDTLITINREDYSRVKNCFHATNIVYVPGVGVDTDIYTNEGLSLKKKRELREKKLPICCSLNDIILFSVGELNNNKNHRVIIKALGKIRNPNIFYFIAGIGGQKERLKKYIEELGLSKQVYLLGYRDDIDDLMRLSDIFVLPSRREGLNVSLMEAMSSGLPCVVSKIRGNCDLIEYDKGGYLVDVDDDDGWKESIVKICSREAERERFGKYNKLRIKDFSQEKVQGIMAAIYSGRYFQNK
ncbi:glycosyltransferase family 4 protein [Selenomonas sp. ND2010]|uniref:glycosyltransferase family 4 protein n=1 Tax=Selenomonas sp. ND2010 TaxID=1410618 RepID=UPI00068FA1B4|nr:glycosyltransferase family 4 protein [Selenomonas sp. ND2010]